MRGCFGMFRASIKAMIAHVAAIRPPRRIVQQRQFENSAAFGAAGIGAPAVSAVVAGKIQEWDVHISSRRLSGWGPSFLLTYFVPVLDHFNPNLDAKL